MFERYEPAAISYVEPMTDPDSALLLIADDAARLHDMQDAALATGGRTTAAIGFADAAARLERQSRIDAVMIDTTGVGDALAHETLVRIDTVARERHIPVVASFPLEHVDMVAAQMMGPHATLLCDPSLAQRCAALALVGRAMPEARLHDIAREAERQRLRRLNEEVARIAETLARLARTEPSPVLAQGVSDRSLAFTPPPPGDTGAAIDGGTIRAAIRTRRLREQFFDRELFADPAWDMLLDLFAAHLEHVRVSVSSLCIAASVPPTTGLRWIGTMRDAGLFERQDDPFDRRRAFIGLSQAGLTGMHGYVTAARKAGLAIA